MSAPSGQDKMARAFLDFVSGLADASRSGTDPDLIEGMASAFVKQAAPAIEKAKRMRAQVAALMPAAEHVAPFVIARCFVREKPKNSVAANAAAGSV